MKELFLFSTDLLTDSDEAEPFGAPFGFLTRTRIVPERASEKEGHEGLIHLIPLKGQTGLQLESAMFGKMERLLRRVADHRLTSTFKMAPIVESMTFDSELFPWKKSAVSFTGPQSTMSMSFVKWLSQALWE